jgi:hypothetical protein
MRRDDPGSGEAGFFCAVSGRKKAGGGNRRLKGMENAYAG